LPLCYLAAPHPHFAGETTHAADYWGYVIPAHLLSLTAGVMHNNKLMLVLDLDATLVQAHTVDSLQKATDRVKASR
jgi:predicted enzyme involved in methoxymalonyl-ACP biosynthesis